MILKAIDALKTSPPTKPPAIGGFITTERRDGRGERCGFDVVTVGTDPPATGTLATKAIAGSRPGKGVPAVGNYIVDVPDFERIALDVLTNTAVRPSITVIDEVGKMELHSADFLPAVHAVMADETTTVLGTIPMPRYGRAVPAVEAGVEKGATHSERILYMCTSRAEHGIDTSSVSTPADGRTDVSVHR